MQLEPPLSSRPTPYPARGPPPNPVAVRKRASLVPALPAARLAGAFLRIAYPCGRVSWLHMPDLAVSGRDVTLAEGIRKLRCQECGSTAAQVVLAPRYPPQRGDERGMLVVRG